MSSSFKKAQKNTPTKGIPGRMQGVKPWINGQNLVSSGHKELDEILGGGFALGSTCILHEDVFSNYAETLMSYSIAEAISQGHKTLIICRNKVEAKEIMSALPFNMNKGAVSLNAKDEESADSRKQHLKIAWQYGKYIKDTPSESTSTSKTPFCSSYDLANKLQRDVLRANLPRVYFLYPEEDADSFHWDAVASNPDIPDVQLLPHLYEKLQSISNVISAFKLAHAEANTPFRIFIPRLSGLAQKYTLTRSAMDLINYHVLQWKHLTCPLSTLLMTVQDDTLPAAATSRWMHSLDALANTVLQVDSFAGREGCIPVEFRFFCGFFLVHKLQQIGSMAPHRPSACRYGLKRDRRKLRVEPLHLPPEDSRASKYDSEGATGTSNQLTASPGAVVAFQRRVETEQTAISAIQRLQQHNPSNAPASGLLNASLSQSQRTEIGARSPMAGTGLGGGEDRIGAAGLPTHVRGSELNGTGGRGVGQWGLSDGITAIPYMPPNAHVHPHSRGRGSPPPAGRGGGPGSICGSTIPGQHMKYDF